MSFPNRLPANSYEGTIDGIEIRWGPSAITRLSDNASLFPAGLETMKGVTEDLGYACAKRLGKNRVKILGAFHDHTTNSATGERCPDGRHCTYGMSPGQIRVHVYVDLTETMPIEEMKVLGEGVVLNNTTTPDPTLSIGTYSY
ncbi:hypothetical protein MaudCBS49596_007421 [Microsporum audouinii]